VREARQRSRKRFPSHARRHAVEAEKISHLNGWIKSDPALRSIPIIAVTSYALNGKDKKAREAGCTITFLSPTARVWFFGQTGPRGGSEQGRPAIYRVSPPAAFGTCVWRDAVKRDANSA
jgi:hypothetical protein